MATKNITKMLLKELSSRTSLPMLQSGTVRRFHLDSTTPPEVPLALHDPDYFFTPEDESPLKLFVPEVRRVDIDELRMKSETTIKYIMNMDAVEIRKQYENFTSAYVQFRQRIFNRTKNYEIIIISQVVLESAKEMPSRFSNYFISNNGIVSMEKIAQAEKIRTNLKDVGSKITELTNKLPLSAVSQQWEIIKGKLPSWQDTISTKLQAIQDSINKRLNPEAKDK